MFTHLHVHTMYSVLDGAGRIEDMISRAKELGMTSLAITDHGTMFGAYHFYKECKKQGIKPIIGCEFYLKHNDEQFHLILLAENYNGIKNLYKLQEYAHTDGYGERKPCIDERSLLRYSSNLICCTACLAGPVARLIMRDSQFDVREMMQWLLSIFGPERLFLELQSNSIPEQFEVNKRLVKLAAQYGLPLVLTADIHYTLKEDAYAHEVQLALQTGKKMSDEGRFRFSGVDYWLKSEDEMRQSVNYLDSTIVDKAIANTGLIADMCNVEFVINQNLLPQFVCPGTQTEETHLTLLLDDAYQKLMIKMNASEEVMDTYEDRLTYEFQILKDKGYLSYFLIVHDYIRWAKRKGILVGPGRGSAGGSLIAYLLGIVDVDPIKHGLLFERFLNPDRVSLPDIDVDFEYNRRHEVIEYLVNKYDWNKVAQIITFGQMTAKAVTRKVLSCFDFKQHEIKKIADQIPDKLGVTITDAIENPEFKKYMIRYPEQYKVIARLENVVSHAGRHAAGVVITPTALSNYLPVYKLKSEDTLIAQFPKKQLEEVGAYKFDILGLKTLSLISDTCQMVKENEGIDVTYPEMDIPTYEFLRNGNLDGIFQFDGESGKRAIKQVQPTSFDDIIACEAICRPGVKEADLYVKNRQADYRPIIHPIIDEVLYETYGAIVYQEQTMLLMNKLAGWTLGKADGMRKVKNLEEYREEFVRDCVNRGIDLDLSNLIYNRFDLGYSFNKSHACAYAYISYMTAYLKANYYKYFMTALMNMDFDDSTKISAYISEVKKNGIEIVPPDINKSRNSYTVVGDKIYFALSSIAGIGEKALVQIEANRPYTSLSDLYERCSVRICNKKVVEALIKSGAFDFEDTRLNLMRKYHALRGEKCELSSLSEPHVLEKELLGTYLSSHPMDKYFFKTWSEIPQSSTALVGGIVEEVKSIVDRNGRKMCFVKLDTKEGIREVVVFADLYKLAFVILSKGRKVMIQGKKDNNSVLANSVKELF